MADIFVSYARTDKALVAPLVAALQGEGWSVWWDPEIAPGQEFDRLIAAEIEAAKAVIVVWTPASVDSRWVRGEAREAADLGVLVPVRFGNVRLPIDVRSLHTCDLDGWNNDPASAAFQDLLRALRAFVEPAANAGVVPNRAPDTAPGRIVSAATSPARARLAPWAFGALVALLALVGAGVLLWEGRSGESGSVPAAAVATPSAASSAPAAPAPARLAVLPIEVSGSDPGLEQFVSGLAAAMIGKLSQSGAPVVARQDSERVRGQSLAAAAEQLRFSLAFESSVERDADDLLVRLQLDDATKSATIWSGEFRAAARNAVALQQEVAAVAMLVGKTASGVAQLAAGDTELMSLLVKDSLFGYRNRVDELSANWANAKRLAEKMPMAAPGHATLAIVSAMLAAHSTPENAADLRATAEQEIARSLELAPNNNVIAAWASAALLPMVGHWEERERRLMQVGNFGANWNSNFLREVGRLEEALDQGRLAQAPLPNSPNRDATLLLALAATGRMGEAVSFAQAIKSLWPAHSAVWNARLQTLLAARRWQEGGALFDEGPDRPIEVSDAIAAVWQRALQAMQSNDAAARRAAATAMTAIVGPSQDAVSVLPNEVYDQGSAIAMMALLGDRDLALQQARVYLAPDSNADSSFLFWAGLADLRADPRFMQLAVDIGLAGYWQSTGKWPDFCTSAAAPYDCKAEAGRLAGTSAAAARAH